MSEKIRKIGELDEYVLNGVKLDGEFVDVLKEKKWIFVEKNVENSYDEENEKKEGGIKKFMLKSEEGILKGIEKRIWKKERLVLKLEKDDGKEIGIDKENFEKMKIVKKGGMKIEKDRNVE